MQLVQLQQIVEIEKYKSISKAAKALFVGQPSLSKSLNNLENEIGIRIFERSASGVIPTMEGKEIIQIARHILEECNQILNYGEQPQELRGSVDLYIVPAYGFIYSDILISFKSQFPKAHLNFHVYNSEEIVELISQGSGNIGLVMWGCVKQQRIENLRKIGLHIETFQSENMMLYVSSEHSLSKTDCVMLDQIRHEKFIAYSEAHWNSINRLIQTEEEPLIMLDRDAMMQMIALNKGIAVFPEKFAVNNLYVDHGMIKLIPIKGSENFCSVMECLISPEGRPLTILEQKTELLLSELLKNVGC